MQVLDCSDHSDKRNQEAAETNDQDGSDLDSNTDPLLELRQQTSIFTSIIQHVSNNPDAMDVFYTCAITSALLSASERLVFCFKATHEDSALIPKLISHRDNRNTFSSCS